MTVEQKEDENSVGMEYTKEQTCLDCKHCNQCYKQRHQGSNKACDDIELLKEFNLVLKEHGLYRNELYKRAELFLKNS